MASFFERDRAKWRYDFILYGHRYHAPRGFRTKKQSDAAERALRDQIMASAAGIPSARTPAPRFTDWAGVAYAYAVEREHLADPATLKRMLAKVLQFWGEAPDEDPIAHAPYHDLTLDAPIRDGSWLLQFEQWMTAQALAGSTKNHYRSAVSKLYRVAMLPEYRTQTQITLNPFRGILRDRPVRRTTVFTTTQLRAVLRHASPLLVLAIRIASLAPELRLGNIAALTWSQIDPRLQWITIADHKTARRTGRPLVTPIVPTLRRYLQDAQRQQPKGCLTVLEKDGQPVKLRQIQRALKDACTAADVTYGMGDGEVTFHTLRHTAATLMAEIGIPDGLRQAAIGHGSGATTAGYTHLRPRHKIAPLSRLARHLGPALEGPSGRAPTPVSTPRAQRRVSRKRQKRQ